MDIQWNAKSFDELTTTDLYEIVVLREAVFVVEQNCVYQDADGKDFAALHLCGKHNGALVAYSRIYPEKGAIHIGRVVTASEYRKKGLAYELMHKAHDLAAKNYSGFNEIHISAQKYLEEFYRKLGYKIVGEEYLEDGIPHIAMYRLMPEPQS
jgi:ElaA protein